jgi:[ribosomal protein S18]-alanine N-acetyltransferase
LLTNERSIKLTTRTSARRSKRIVQIRTATLADILVILSLERQSPAAGHWTEQQYRDMLQPGNTERLVLLGETSSPPLATKPASRILGFLVAHHLPPDWELENIAIAPQERRKGLGKYLLEALLAAARRSNSVGVFLEVRESNTAARSFYQKVGFEQTGRRRSYYANPVEDAVLYRLTLG